MKTCSKCGVSRDETEFYAASEGRLRGDCLHCISGVAKKRYATLSQVREAKITSAQKRYWSDPASANKRSAAYRLEHSKDICVSQRINQQKRLHKDPRFKVTRNLRKRLYDALKGAGAKKSAAAFELLGCPIVWLEVHIESLFKPGMTWKNYGPVWHIDHIKPCSRFDLIDLEQQKACFHWTNLQPLFAEENLHKRAKYSGS